MFPKKILPPSSGFNLEDDDTRLHGVTSHKNKVHKGKGKAITVTGREGP
jgi:hypothetical protein